MLSIYLEIKVEAGVVENAVGSHFWLLCAGGGPAGVQALQRAQGVVGGGWSVSEEKSHFVSDPACCTDCRRASRREVHAKTCSVYHYPVCKLPS